MALETLVRVGSEFQIHPDQVKLFAEGADEFSELFLALMTISNEFHFLMMLSKH